MSVEEDMRRFRQAWANLADALIDGGPWRRLFAWAGWKRGQFPSQSGDE